MIFDPKQPQAFLDAFRQAANANIEDYTEELFLVGKLLPSCYDEVGALLRLSQKDVYKAYKGKRDLITTGKHTDYAQHLQAIIAYGKSSRDLRLGRMMNLLGRPYIYIDKSLGKDSPVKKNIALLERFNGIEEVNIGDIEQIPAELATLPLLRRLRIEAWKAQKPLSFDFSLLPNLEELCLEGRLQQPLPPSIKNLPNLHKLVIKGGQLVLSFMELPDWLGDLPQLRRLELMYHSAAKLEETIFAPTLEKIVLFRMPQLIHFPAALPRCSALRVISTAHCPNLQLSPAVATLEEK